MKKLIVVSHERSGTHFLINSITNNSGGVYGRPYPLEPYKDVYHDGPYDDPKEYKEYVYAWLNSYRGVSESKIFKTHHKAEFFKDYLADIKEEYHILYIRRNPLDVLTSLYHYYRNCEPGNQPHQNFSLDIDDFLFNKTPKDDWYSLTPNSSNAERLKEHVNEWSELGVDMVFYEDLKLDYQNTMGKIFNVLGLSSPKVFKETMLSGIRPRKGEINDHINLFNNNQISRLRGIFNV